MSKLRDITENEIKNNLTCANTLQLQSKSPQQLVLQYKTADNRTRLRLHNWIKEWNLL